ncbi:MAG: hypothetical protein J6126_01990 [Clostridia bacterium]|nr:hypothetical protein [Clostridia bacterium]
MNLRRLPATLDTIFVFTAAFAAAFTVMRYYVKFLWAAIAVGLLLGAGLATVYSLLRAKKNAVYALKRKDAEMLERVMDAMCLSSESELINYFRTLFQKAEVPFFEENGKIILKKQNAELTFYFTFSDTYGGRIIDFYKQSEKGRGVVVLGREFGEEARSLAVRFGGRITLIDGATLFLFMKRFECFPPLKPELKSPRRRFTLPREIFGKKRARQYFLYGVVMEFFSLFVFWPIYYLAFGTALILLSLFCFFFGAKEIKELQNPFGEN